MTNKAFEESLAQTLAERGEEMNLEISSDHGHLLCAFHGSDYFLVAVANAFTWTGHAVKEDAFLKFAVDYLATGDLASLRRAERFSGRFGTEGLSTGLRGWKAIVGQLVAQDFPSCNAQGLCKIQEQCLDIASRLLNQKHISGVGPWLFCAPFKIVAAHRRDLWQSGDLDDLYMPLGLEVVRGVCKLIEHGCTYTQGLDCNMLSEQEGGLVEGMGTVALVQDMSKRVAQIGRTRVLHVNSGLYLYGRGDL